MNHTPTITTNGLVICGACLTTAGTMVTVKGDETVDHLAVVALEVRKRAQQVTPIMDRLRDHYSTGRPIAWELFCIGQQEGSGATTEAFVLKHGSTGALSLAQLQRLYRAVLGEFAI